MASQSVACTTPSIRVNPVGVCIHELSTRIQNADMLVPTATSTVASVCMRLDTLPMPNSMIARNVASRKNAVSTS